MTGSNVLTIQIAQRFLECFEGLPQYTLIEDAAAECLAKFGGGQLDLSGLTSLSDTAAQSLQKHR